MRVSPSEGSQRSTHLFPQLAQAHCQLEHPDIFPILSVPSDPNFYLDGTKYKPEEQRTSHQYCGNIPLRMTKTECGCAVCVPPFGHMDGLTPACTGTSAMRSPPAGSLQQEAKKIDATPNVDDDKFEIACLLIFVLAISSFLEP